MSSAPRKAKPRLGRLWPMLAPIYWLALVNAIVCWTLTWVFWDRFEFSATLFALGCMPIAVAVSVYLFLLLRKVDGK